MAGSIDFHIGKRLRRRRRLLGMTQQELADAVGVRCQQIQKYECGSNRMSASRLHDLASALKVKASYFFDGMAHSQTPPQESNIPKDLPPPEVIARNETLELIRVYYKLGERQRRGLLELAQALQEPEKTAGAA